MIITVASFKGGVGKTTTAVHLAAVAYRQGKKRTLLIDGDPNRSAAAWSKRGKGFPFDILDESRAAGQAAQYAVTVVDTQARPSDEDMRTLSRGSDLMILPVTPDFLAIDALLRTVEALRGMSNFRVLLTAVPPKPSRAGNEAGEALRAAGWPVMRASVRRLAAFQRAALLGCLVGDVPGDSRAGLGWADYLKVGEEAGIYGRGK